MRLCLAPELSFRIGGNAYVGIIRAAAAREVPRAKSPRELFHRASRLCFKLDWEATSADRRSVGVSPVPVNR